MSQVEQTVDVETVKEHAVALCCALRGWDRKDTKVEECTINGMRFLSLWREAIPTDSREKGESFVLSCSANGKQDYSRTPSSLDTWNRFLSSLLSRQQIACSVADRVYASRYDQ